jgi:hypothetical protein
MVLPGLVSYCVRKRQNRIGSFGETASRQLPSGSGVGTPASDQESGASLVLVSNTPNVGLSHVNRTVFFIFVFRVHELVSQYHRNLA